MNQARAAFLDPDHRVTLVVALWATEAMDVLAAKLDHADEEGKTLLDATYTHGIVFEAMAEMHDRAMCAANNYYPLSCIIHHFEVALVVSFSYRDKKQQKENTQINNTRRSATPPPAAV